MAGVLIAALWAFLDPSANCRFRVAVLALGPSRPFEFLTPTNQLELANGPSFPRSQKL